MKECVYCGNEIENGIFFCKKCKKVINDTGYINAGSVIGNWEMQAYWYLESNNGNYWKNFNDMSEIEKPMHSIRPIDYVRFDTYRKSIGAELNEFAMSAEHLNDMEKWYLKLAEEWANNGR